jgi:hypothetical protein
VFKIFISGYISIIYLIKKELIEVGELNPDSYARKKNFNNAQAPQDTSK